MSVTRRPSARTDPVPGAWCDDAQAVDDALAVLRLPATDVDRSRMEQCAATACALITAFLDRPDDDPVAGLPDPLRTAHYMVTIELYRRKDAPFGVLNAWSPDEGQMRIPTDPLRGVYHILLPYKRQWGVA